MTRNPEKIWNKNVPGKMKFEKEIEEKGEKKVGLELKRI